MSGATRFARSGRWRLFVCGGVIILLLTMLVIFHNQQELDEKRELRLRSLNDQLQSILEQKYDLERNNENERIKQTDVRRDLEQKLSELRELQSKDQLRYEKLIQSHKALQSKYYELAIETEKRKSQHQEYVNDMEKKLQEQRSKIENEKAEESNELLARKKKIDTMIEEKEQMERLIAASNAKYEHLLNEYKVHCGYQFENNAQVHLNKPLHPPDTISHHDNGTLHNQSDAHQAKSFSKQETVSPGLYRIEVKTTNLTEIQYGANMIPTNSTIKSNGSTVTQLPPILKQQANSGLILNSVENFQIVPKPLRKLSAESENKFNRAQSVVVSPLSAPRKPTSTDGSKAEKQVLGPVPVPEIVQKSTNSSTPNGSSLSPLQLPPNPQRKFPENVAPIPAYFDDLLKNEIANQKLPHKTAKKEKIVNADLTFNNNAAKVKNGNNDNNNRYANIVNDLGDGLAHNAKKEVIEDSGAHEIKDHDMNADNFNLPADDSNFFAGDNDGIAGDKIANVGPVAIDNDRDNGQRHKDDDDDILGVGGADTGDIAVKNRNQLLDAAENLNNEVAGDQGKEFPADELHLEDGNDEDPDEDDFSNLAARQQGAQAIRN